MSITSADLKEKVMKALDTELDKDEVSASIIAQAINFLKTFPPEKEPGDPGELSPALKKLQDRLTPHTPLQ